MEVSSDKWFESSVSRCILARGELQAFAEECEMEYKRSLDHRKSVWQPLSQSGAGGVSRSSGSWAEKFFGRTEDSECDESESGF